MSLGQMGGIVGGLVGGVLGLAGGTIGTYCSLRHAKGPREREFLIRAVIITWIGILLFLVLLFTLPSPWRHLLWIPYGILLPTGIIAGNKRIIAIRREEAGGRKEETGAGG